MIEAGAHAIERGLVEAVHGEEGAGVEAVVVGFAIGAGVDAAAAGAAVAGPWPPVVGPWPGFTARLKSGGLLPGNPSPNL